MSNNYSIGDTVKVFCPGNDVLHGQEIKLLENTLKDVYLAEMKDGHIIHVSAQRFCPKV